MAPTRLRSMAARHYAVPVLLAAVATLQLVRAHTLEQSSWSGGGFGMFATYENEDSRFLRLWLLTADGEERRSLPSGVAHEAFEARAVPTGERLDALARLVDRNLGGRDALGVRVEVWGVHFDHPDARLRTFRIAEATHRR
jgi:hypothetical protein